MKDGAAAATYAVVIDTCGVLIDAPCSKGASIRLLMQQEDAEALWRKLEELFR